MLMAIFKPNPEESIDDNTTVILYLSWRKCDFQILDVLSKINLRFILNFGYIIYCADI
jgi:hypothetical protein